MVFKEKYLKSVSGFKYKLIKWLYLKSSFTRKIAQKYIHTYEGGEYYSQTLRKIYREVYDIDVGIGTYGGIFSKNFRPHVKCGAYCSIAQGVQRLYANHPMDEASMHPLFHLKEFGMVKENKNPLYELEIGNDVWIGVNAILTAKCQVIGDGAVIGAGSVVTQNVEPYAIVAGNPAKVIRYRFPEEERKLLMESKWYQLTPDELGETIAYITDIEEFVKAVERVKVKFTER